MKLTVLTRFHSPKCDFRKHKHGNMYDLSARKMITIKPPMVYKYVDLDAGGDIVIIGKTQNFSAKVPLGISTQLPKWYGAKVPPRSSLFKHFGCILANSVGEIEASYSGEWFAHLIKLAPGELNVINPGDRIVQMQIYLLPEAPWYIKLRHIFVSGFNFKEVDIIHPTRDGHGSTGIN